MKITGILSIMVVLAAGVSAEVSTAPQTTVPQGEYAVARLELPAGLNGKAYILGAHLIRIVEIATGKLVNECKSSEFGPGSNPWLGVVGDRFLLIPDGQHGTAQYAFLDRALKNLGPLWRPSHTPTTAYNSQPIIAPVVDGRVFIRGGDGIYCYDLRAAP